MWLKGDWRVGDQRSGVDDRSVHFLNAELDDSLHVYTYDPRPQPPRARDILSEYRP